MCIFIHYSQSQEASPGGWHLSKPEDLLATSHLGRSSLYQACQQVILAEDWLIKYNTINTHIGLYKHLYTFCGIISHVPRGCELTGVGIPGVSCYHDDAWVMDANNTECFISVIWNRCSNVSTSCSMASGWRRPSRSFSNPLWTTLAILLIGAEGPHVTTGKLEAMVRAPALRTSTIMANLNHIWPPHASPTTVYVEGFGRCNPD